MIVKNHEKDLRVPHENIDTNGRNGDDDKLRRY